MAGKNEYTVFDYLQWRGDLTLQQDPFNEVDNLVLCIISYINFRRITVVHTTEPAAAPTLAQVAPLLTEEEHAVFKRGRNANVHSIPHHASRAQYSTATALEALFGWLYLGGQRQRASDLFDVMMEE